VGTMPRRRRGCAWASVHPHGRGDNARRQAVVSRLSGSPPRAWGQWVSGLLLQKFCRFTPTGVGTMSGGSSRSGGSSVHPHGRGDNANGCGVCATIRGSPPRAWGQSRGSGGRCVGVRFTPTGVGTITTEDMPVQRGPVHPHGRGDNLHRRIRTIRQDGSPPRAWGQCVGDGARRASARFTPTGVGTIPAGRVGYASHAVHPHGRGDNLAPNAAPKFDLGSPPRAWGQSRSEGSPPD